MTTELVALKWYTFRQNNSFGAWIGPHYVLVQATNAEHANALAVESGHVYFDDDRSRDCPCCGDRWTRVDESDAEPVPRIYDEDVPEDAIAYNSRYSDGATIAWVRPTQEV